MTWIAAYVGHIDAHVLHMEKLVSRVLHSYNVVVNVAMYGPKWFEVSQGFGSFNVANVTRVPQLVNEDPSQVYRRWRRH